MRILIQRVKEAQVRVGGQWSGKIEHGYLLLVAVMSGDTAETCHEMSEKILKMRLFPDSQGKMNHSLLDTKGAILLVSQFTLAADTRKGNRPSFSTAARPEEALALLGVLRESLKKSGLTVQEGVFGAHMEVSLVNDGPVTLWIDSQEASR